VTSADATAAAVVATATADATTTAQEASAVATATALGSTADDGPGSFFEAFFGGFSGDNPELRAGLLTLAALAAGCGVLLATGFANAHKYR
jgi:hypothetical protein